MGESGYNLDLNLLTILYYRRGLVILGKLNFIFPSYFATFAKTHLYLMWEKNSGAC